AHGERAAAMTSLHQELRIGEQERLIHGHGCAVRRQEALVLAETLDERENIIPAPGIETGNVIAQFEQDLVHFEGRRQRFDQDRSLDGLERQAELLLCEDEDVVPEPRLAMRLKLWQIEVRTAARGERLL